MSEERHVTGPLKAALWKELRQAVHWGALGLIVTGAWLAYVLRNHSNDPDALLRWIYESTAILSAIVALLIGVVQALPESRGDKWAFLTHRPVPRSTLLLAKAIAGLTVYVAAIGFAVAGAIAWIAAPGHVAMPLDWRMILPVVTNVLSGVAFYCGGLLIGLRNARLYGSRVAGVGVPLVCTVVQLNVGGFWQALVWCVVGITITGAAAWGSFIAKERFENQPLGLRAATGITVGTELALAGVIGVVLVTTPLSFPDSLFESKNSAYAVTRNGEIVRETLQGPRVISVSGVDGQSIDSPVGPNEDGAAVASARLSEPRDRGYNDTEHFFINITGSKQSNVLWLYVARLGLIADYDTASRQLLGWFGPDGFSAGETPPQTRFSGTPLFRARLYEINRSFLLPFPNSVYRMNVDGSIELVFTPEAGERVTGASVRGICFRCTDFDLIATTRRVAVVAPNGSVEFSAPRDPRATGYPEVRVFRPPQAVATTVVWYSPAIEITDPTTPQRAHELVTRYGPNEAHYDLPVLVTSSPASWSRVFVPWFVTPVTMPVGMVLSRAPISWRAVDRSLPTQWFGVDEYGGTSSMNHETYSNGQRVVVWGLSALNSFLSALLAARIGRAWALAKRRRLFWTIASFLLGSLGLMVMLCLFERPVTEQCPACKRMRVVTRENCEHCGERFPAPARDGTEIFESLSAY